MWHRYRKELQGTIFGNEGTPFRRVKEICDLDLCIWHFTFGIPGMLDKLNILDLAQNFSRMIAGVLHTVDFTYAIDEVSFYW